MHHFDQETLHGGTFLVDGVLHGCATIGCQANANKQKQAKSPFCASFCAETPEKVHGRLFQGRQIRSH